MREIKRAEIGVEVLVDELVIDAEVVSVGSWFWLRFQRREVQSILNVKAREGKYSKLFWRLSWN